MDLVTLSIVSSGKEKKESSAVAFLRRAKRKVTRPVAYVLAGLATVTPLFSQLELQIGIPPLSRTELVS